MKQLDGKIAIITGSTKGIGKAIAKRFLEEGAKVVISSRSQENIARALSEFNSPNVAGKVCDVSRYSEVESLIDFAIERFGALDILVNNAGVAEPFARIINAPLEAWYAPIETNLKGTYHGCRAVLPYFLKRGKGKIINMAGAGTGRFNTPYISGYGSSKAAIYRLTMSLSEEYKGTGVDIMLLNPGMVRTEILGLHAPSPELQKRLQTFEKVIDIFGQPPSVAAGLAVKLASTWSDGKTKVFLSALSRPRSQWLLLTYPFRKFFGKIDRTDY
jgi:NAD(P)-dependent dehydrogenase (short-subunit alcohol dehydrogenase family)